jgi:hypothetical protein
VDIESREAPEGGPGETLVQLRARDERYLPLDNVQILLEVSQAGAAEPSATNRVRLQMEPSLKEPGLYEATFTPRLTGGYLAAAVVTNAHGAELGRATAGWAVDLAAQEFKSLTPNLGLLENLARETGGKVLALDDLQSFIKDLPYRTSPVMEPNSRSLWNTPVVFGLALILFLSEWGLRRWKGMA